MLLSYYSISPELLVVVAIVQGVLPVLSHAGFHCNRSGDLAGQSKTSMSVCRLYVALCLSGEGRNLRYSNRFYLALYRPMIKLP